MFDDFWYLFFFFCSVYCCFVNVQSYSMLIVINLSTDSQHLEARYWDTWGSEWPTKDAAERAGQTQWHTEGRWQQVSETSLTVVELKFSVEHCCVLGTGKEKFRESVHCASLKLQSMSEDCFFVSVGFFVLGRTLSHAASPTPLSVPSVVEQATSPLTASTPGDEQFNKSKNLSWEHNCSSFYEC